MGNIKKISGSSSYAVQIFFLAHFSYFIFAGKYALIYQEQIRLFRYDLRFLSDFVARPGGLTDYLGAFLIQFYHIPVLGAVILTLAGFSVCILSSFIFRKFKIQSIVPGLIPVAGLILLQTDPYFTVSSITGLIISLGITVVYLNIKESSTRYYTGIIFWILLYAVTGGFSFFALLIFLINELFSAKNRYTIPVFIIWILAAIAIPYLSWIFIFRVPLPESWISQNLWPLNLYTRAGFLLLLLYYPVVMIASGLWTILPGKHAFVWGLNLYTLIVFLLGGALIYISFPGFKKLLMNYGRIATTMKIDSCIQKGHWEKGLKISANYRGTDPLIVFFTNICLLKSGQMSDSMFYYNQIGRGGLFLGWTEDNVTPFFGGEIFYQLGYNNEAYRWAFEAFISTGPGVRICKRIIVTSSLNGDYKTALKYLDVLDNSLFYRKWAVGFRKYLNDKGRFPTPDELKHIKVLQVSRDFFYDLDDYRINMKNLLENNPADKNVFEYTMALHLLEKNLPAFVSDIQNLRKYGYGKIPVHYEEALLVYIVNTNQDVVPKGYSISGTTLQRFRHYISTFSIYVARPKIEAARVLVKEYGNTYWYYSQFY